MRRVGILWLKCWQESIPNFMYLLSSFNLKGITLFYSLLTLHWLSCGSEVQQHVYSSIGCHPFLFISNVLAKSLSDAQKRLSRSKKQLFKESFPLSSLYLQNLQSWCPKNVSFQHHLLCHLTKPKQGLFFFNSTNILIVYSSIFQLEKGDKRLDFEIWHF